MRVGFTFDPFDRELPEYFFENFCRDDMTLLMREQEIREDAREAALAEARVEEIKSVVDSLRSFGIPDEAIKVHLMERYQLSKEDAKEYMD